MMTYVKLAVLVTVVAGSVVIGAPETGASPEVTTRVSVDSAGNQADTGPSRIPAISADGRLVAFQSDATDLVQGDTNAARDIFLHDRQTGGTERVNVNNAGDQASNFSSSDFAAISANGEHVAFQSSATNLDMDLPDTNGKVDVFVRHVPTGITTRVSVSTAGQQGNGHSQFPAISADGRYVAFQSDATNLDLVLADTNGKADVFVHDRQTGVTSRVSLSTAGAEGDGASRYPAISAHGRHVAFQSDATNLVLGDTNGKADVFVHDRQTAVTTRVSLSTAGAQGDGASGDPAISTSGAQVAFASLATNLVPPDTNDMYDVFVRDRDTDADGAFDEPGAVSTTRVSVDYVGGQTNSESIRPAISADGLLVAFESFATDLVLGDTNDAWDIFVRHRQAGPTERVSVDSAGNQASYSGHSEFPAISADGRHVAFESLATNLDLVLPDTNGTYDVFVYEAPKMEAVGGTVELLVAEPHSPPRPAQGAASSAVPYAAIAAGAAAAIIALAACAWYGRRRWLR